MHIPLNEIQNKEKNEVEKTQNTKQQRIWIASLTELLRSVSFVHCNTKSFDLKITSIWVWNFQFFFLSFYEWNSLEIWFISWKSVYVWWKSCWAFVQLTEIMKLVFFFSGMRLVSFLCEFFWTFVRPLVYFHFKCIWNQ